MSINEATNRSNPNMRKMVMVGHRMGCNLTNLLIRDGGDHQDEAAEDRASGGG